jgi:hypothetical protein
LDAADWSLVAVDRSPLSRQFTVLSVHRLVIHPFLDMRTDICYWLMGITRPGGDFIAPGNNMLKTKDLSRYLCRFFADFILKCLKPLKKLTLTPLKKKLKCFETTFLHEITVKKRKKRVQKVEKQWKKVLFFTVFRPIWSHAAFSRQIFKSMRAN